MINIEQMLKNGVELHTAGNLKAAEEAYRKVLNAVPEHPDAIHFLGVLAFNVNQMDTAKELIARAIQLSPDNPACYLNLGNVFNQEGDISQAVKWYERSRNLNPDNPKIHNNIGVALSKLTQYEASVESFEAALKLNPDYAEAHNNLSESYKFLGLYEKAFESSNRAIELVPDFVAAKWNRSILLLLKGDLINGFKEYEWRWRRPQSRNRQFDTGIPWQGQPLEGKTVFVYEEQGLGDTIQFVRYLPFVQNVGGKVIFEVVPALQRLALSSKGYDRLLVGIANVDTRPVDRFDYHISLLSLAAVFNTTLETVPGKTPYLFADTHLSNIWKTRMGKQMAFKIGIVWAGHPEHRNDHNRSIPVSFFSFLKQFKGVKLFALQKEKHERWTDIDPDQIFEQDLGEQISDFADTAAIIENMDLVISVDTAVVHLAGALGKPVWTLLPFSPDWRWMLDRDDSPWYPTMRLFRQPAPGDWASVFENVGQALGKLLE